jgi:hypothetical protein
MLETFTHVACIVTIVNYASSIVNKLGALLTNDARVIIYDHHMFIVQATGVNAIRHFFSVTDEETK